MQRARCARLPPVHSVRTLDLHIEERGGDKSIVVAGWVRYNRGANMTGTELRRMAGSIFRSIATDEENRASEAEYEDDTSL